MSDQTANQTEEKIIENFSAMEPQSMYCVKCGRFLGYQLILLGSVKFKCPNCHEWHTIDIFPGD